MTTNILPGMSGHSVEFFKDGEDLKTIHKGNIISDFASAPFFIIDALREEVRFSPLTEKALLELHPNDELKRLKQLATCRFGGLDYEADIQDGRLQDGEYWPCPIHGSCAHEGVLCKLPVVNGERLEATEVKLIKLLVTDRKNEVVAIELNIPLGSLHLAKKKLYAKLGVQTKQELALLANRLNIV